MIKVTGILELITSQSIGGDSIYTIDLETISGEGLYSVLGEYEGKKVRITLEEIAE